MTLHISDTHLSFRVLALSKKILPANKCPLSCGLSLSPALQRRVQPKRLLSLSMSQHTFPSPLRWAIPIIKVYLPVCLSADLGYMAPWSAAQYCTESVFRGGTFHTLYSVARIHPAPAGSKETCKSKNISISENLLKNESLSCDDPNIEGSSMPHFSS